jgi:hypothetical protein
MSGPVLNHECHKDAEFPHKLVEYVFLFDEPLKRSKSFKIFKISLRFRFEQVVTFIKIRSHRRKNILPNMKIVYLVTKAAKSNCKITLLFENSDLSILFSINFHAK